MVFHQLQLNNGSSTNGTRSSRWAVPFQHWRKPHSGKKLWRCWRGCGHPLEPGIFEHWNCAVQLRSQPSGEHTKSNWKWWFIVNFPIKNGDFPLQNVSSPESSACLSQNLVGADWNILTICPFSLGISIPTDFHIFSTCSSQLNGKIVPTEWECHHHWPKHTKTYFSEG